MVVVWLFLAMPLICLQFAIVVIPDHTHLLFFTIDHKRQIFLSNLSLIIDSFSLLTIKLRKEAKLKNRYDPVPPDQRHHTESDKNTIKYYTEESQGVTTKLQ